MSTSKKGKSDGEFNAYASKADLLDWVNNLLQLQLTRLEQVCPQLTCLPSLAIAKLTVAL